MAELVYEIDKEKVAWRKIEGEVTILDKKTAEFFNLNSTASQIWHLIQHGETVESIVKYLVKHFDIEYKIIREDVVSLMKEFSQKGFIKLHEK
ncbi:MAG: PqqD family protein [Candidatus Omnitrophica bacterium]|nr:PqqD family protein [Candidatus Omnitrophota bacterium]